MAISYDAKFKQFRKNGKLVSRLAVKGEMNSLLEVVKKESKTLARALKKKEIKVFEFETRMRSLLKSAHIAAASVGKGGRSRMDAADWSRVGAKIKWQNKYLKRFARKLAAGTVSDALTESRAASYASSLWTSFSATFLESQKEFVEDGKNPERCRLITNSVEGCEECAADEAIGWMSVDDMGEIGSRLCGDFCKCDIEFEGEAIPEFTIEFGVELD